MRVHHEMLRVVVNGDDLSSPQLEEDPENVAFLGEEPRFLYLVEILLMPRVVLLPLQDFFQRRPGNEDAPVPVVHHAGGDVYFAAFLVASLEHPPATSMVEVRSLVHKDMLIEIEADAVSREER